MKNKSPDMEKAQNDLDDAACMLKVIERSFKCQSVAPEEHTVLNLAITLIDSVRDAWDDWDMANRQAEKGKS
jgi:hypothetical protein